MFDAYLSNQQSTINLSTTATRNKTTKLLNLDSTKIPPDGQHQRMLYVAARPFVSTTNKVTLSMHFHEFQQMAYQLLIVWILIFQYFSTEPSFLIATKSCWSWRNLTITNQLGCTCSPGWTKVLDKRRILLICFFNCFHCNAKWFITNPHHSPSFLYLQIADKRSCIFMWNNSSMATALGQHIMEY